MSRKVSRRQLLRAAAAGAAVLTAPALAGWGRFSHLAGGPPSSELPTMVGTASRVALVRTSERDAGVRRAIALVQPQGIGGSRVLLKPNINSSTPPPSTTHPDTLRALAEELFNLGAASITLGERAGIGISTRGCVEELGLDTAAREAGVDLLLFDEMEQEGWAKFYPPESHWTDGIFVPRALLEADAVVTTAMLKNHIFGGHFTLSLKISVGLVPFRMPERPEMLTWEMHGSRYIREMIAEINTAYQPALVVVDGVEAMPRGGPARGPIVPANVMIAGTDRVAVDAVCVAILRHLGTTAEVSQGAVFQQTQIRRAAELGLGARSPADIEIVTDDAEGEAYAAVIRSILESEPSRPERRSPRPPLLPRPRGAAAS